MKTGIRLFLDWENGIHCTGIMEWDLTTGKGINNFKNGNGISLLCRSPTLLFDTTAQMGLFLKIKK